MPIIVAMDDLHNLLELPGESICDDLQLWEAEYTIEIARRMRKGEKLPPWQNGRDGSFKLPALDE